MNNEKVMKLFEARELLQADSNMLKKQKDREIFAINSNIIDGLKFMVYGAAYLYRKFPNYEDLVQEGFVGLIRAVNRFDYKRFPNFIVYSNRWINHSIKRAASRFDVVYCKNHTRVVYSEPPETSDDQVIETPEDSLINKETIYKVRRALGDFPKRDQDIINRLFGLENAPQTLREVGPMHGLTYERVRQIKNKVINKLRKHIEINELR